MQVQIVNKSSFPLPSYATSGSSGMDLRANIEGNITLKPLERILVPTGLHIQLETQYEAQIRPRSGLALKYGITVLNAPGTIDSDYTGEIKVLLINHSSEEFSIQPGERIAQMVIQKVEKAQWKEVDRLEDTQRSEGGFGSTGLD